MLTASEKINVHYIFIKKKKSSVTLFILFQLIAIKKTLAETTWEYGHAECVLYNHQ